MEGFVNTWRKKRKQGRFRYALVQGMIFALVITLFRQWEVLFDFQNYHQADFSPVFNYFLIMFLGAASGYYFLIWWWKERLYHKMKGETQTP